MADKDKKFKGEYGTSEYGNFTIIDTIGIPHFYCIGPRHVIYASDHFSGMLGKAAIEEAEKHGITCAVKGCNLSYGEHETALLVECKANMVIPGSKNEACPELHNYLLKIKNEATRNGYTGFAFLDKRNE